MLPCPTNLVLHPANPARPSSSSAHASHSPSCADETGTAAPLAPHATSPVRYPTSCHRAAAPAIGLVPADAAATTALTNRVSPRVHRRAEHPPQAPAAGSPPGMCGSNATAGQAGADYSPPPLLLDGRRAA